MIFKKLGKRKKKHIIMIGGAGWPNYGDELILDAWKRYLIDNNIASQIYFFEGTSERAKSIHDSNEKGVILTFRNDLERLAYKSDVKDFWHQVIRGYRFIDNNGIQKYSEFDFSFCSHSDVVHLHGGGYLTKFWPQKGFLLGFAASLKKHYSIKVVATGIGFGPVNDPQSDDLDTLNEIFSRFDSFELRDKSGFDFLSSRFSLGAFSYGLDDCYLKSLDSIFSERSDREKYLYVSLLKNSVEKIPGEFWEGLIKYVSDNDISRIVYFESSPGQDQEVVKIIKDKINHHVDVLGVSEALKGNIGVSIQDRVLCCRFHTHYIFSRKGIPGAYSIFGQGGGYYGVKHKSIVDRGSTFIRSRLHEFPKEIASKSLEQSSEMFLREEEYHNAKVRVANSIYK